VPRGRRVQVDTIFGEGPPPKIWEGKKRLIFSAISDNFRVCSQISPEQIHISKIGKKRSTTTPPTLGEKRWWTLVHKQKVIDLHVDPPKLNFSTDYISVLFRPLGVLLPQIFTRARNWPRLASAHPGRPHVGLCPIFLVSFTFNSWTPFWI